MHSMFFALVVLRPFVCYISLKIKSVIWTQREGNVKVYKTYSEGCGALGTLSVEGSLWEQRVVVVSEFLLSERRVAFKIR
jgi:hypothetical protein